VCLTGVIGGGGRCRKKKKEEDSGIEKFASPSLRCAGTVGQTKGKEVGENVIPTADVGKEKSRVKGKGEAES